MAVWGYVRVSSKDQNEDRQIQEIMPLVTTESHLLVEKQSGKEPWKDAMGKPEAYRGTPCDLNMHRTRERMENHGKIRNGRCPSGAHACDL